MLEYPAYGALVREWEADVRARYKGMRIAEAKQLLPFCTWSRSNGVALTQEQVDMQSMSKSITKFMKARVGRYIIRAADSERNVKTQQSNIAVPFVGAKGITDWHIGRVLYFFPPFLHQAQRLCLY